MPREGRRKAAHCAGPDGARASRGWRAHGRAWEGIWGPSRRKQHETQTETKSTGDVEELGKTPGDWTQAVYTGTVGTAAFGRLGKCLHMTPTQSDTALREGEATWYRQQQGQWQSAFLVGQNLSTRHASNKHVRQQLIDRYSRFTERLKHPVRCSPFSSDSGQASEQGPRLESSQPGHSSSVVFVTALKHQTRL